nr:COP9 signalosome complex subunit 3-like isoform X2 [Populus alba]
MHFFHGLTYFDEILQEADGVILSRGNLGIDLPPEKVFLFQKTVVFKCNMAGKPAVVTLVVDSMTENLRPPRAEATDVANAILDDCGFSVASGSNAILLGAETLRGLYPVETFSTVGRICAEGMICIGQKHFQKALELLHNVVTAPMSSINAIAVEAFKKYILVSLIQNRQFSTSLPKYTSSAAQRSLKTLCQPYMEVASSYSSGKVSELKTYIQTNKEKFESDNNLGLVKQVISSMYKRNIQRLTQTYWTLSVQDIAKNVQLSSPKEAEMHVLQMIEDGEIYATINQKDGGEKGRHHFCWSISLYRK